MQTITLRPVSDVSVVACMVDEAALPLGEQLRENPYKISPKTSSHNQLEKEEGSHHVDSKAKFSTPLDCYTSFNTASTCTTKSEQGSTENKFSRKNGRTHGSGKGSAHLLDLGGKQVDGLLQLRLDRGKLCREPLFSIFRPPSHVTYLQHHDSRRYKRRRMRDDGRGRRY